MSAAEEQRNPKPEPTGPADCHLHCGYDIYMHTHEFTEVAFVVRGRGRVRVEDHLFRTRQGDVFVMPAGVWHGYTLEKDLDIYHIELYQPFLAQYYPILRMLPGFIMLFTVEPYFRIETGFRYRLRLEGEDRKEMLRLFEMLERELHEEGPVALAAESLTLYVLADLCRRYAQQQPAPGEQLGAHPATQALNAVFDLVAERHADKLTLEDLARVAHMQRSHFCRIFRRVMGMTPMDYVNQYRVHVARRLLHQTERSVTEIAVEVGFYDSSHFCRTFARVTGLSPDRYRKSAALLHGLADVWDLPAFPPPETEE